MTPEPKTITILSLGAGVQSTAPEQWRSQCLVARIQRDEALKSAEHAKAYKRVMKLDNQKLKSQLAAAMSIISAIEERYIDGCDTYEDWKFMGDTARAFLEENARAMTPGAIGEALDAVCDRIETLERWVEEWTRNGSRCAEERDRLQDAVREYRDAKGRYHTQKACERLIALLPENNQINDGIPFVASFSSEI